MGGGGDVVLVVAPPGSLLGPGLVAALLSLEWSARLCDGGTAEPHLRTAPLVLIVQDGTPPVPARRVPTICLGPPSALRSMVEHAERGATVLNRDVPFPVLVGLVDRVLHSRVRPARSPGAAARLRRRAAEAAALDRLTVQEHATLVALMQGSSAHEIATRTSRSLHTVRSHIRAVLMKLDVTSQTAATALAERVGPPLPTQVARGQFINSGDEADSGGG